MSLNLADSAYTILFTLLMSPSLYRKVQIVQIQYLAFAHSTPLSE